MVEVATPPKPDDERRKLAALGAMVAAILVGDLLLPRGFAGGVPYFGVVALSLVWAPRRLNAIAAFCAVLTVLGYLLSPVSGDAWVGLSNRALALVAIASTSLIGSRWRDERIARQVEAERANEISRVHVAELAHVSRMSTMGALTSGLAHELNQPLSAIINYAEACSMAVQSAVEHPEQIVDDLESIIAQAERASDIIRHLRSFVQKSGAPRRAAGVNGLILEALHFVEFDAKMREVKPVLELSRELPLVTVDSVQIQQVFLNLWRNAIEAMQQIEDKHLVVRTALSSEGCVEVFVVDNGHGASPAEISVMFEPFYTTKKEGLGIGLSSSRSIIESHGGKLIAHANDGAGMTFCFSLPAADEVHTYAA